MADNLIRIYGLLDSKAIKPNLLIYGDLSAACAKCNKIDLKLDNANCPGCNTEFKYIAFRNVKVHIPKIHKLLNEKPHIKIIDFDDYKRNEGASKAEDFLRG
ncbi:MAG: hypothetical protein HQL27_09620 [Candidatus Omnitrophica bacterium]|nr:hypothetical protein [Candidatus Omnitrophota bacterium]